jgi:hypothetical protein
MINQKKPLDQVLDLQQQLIKIEGALITVQQQLAALIPTIARALEPGKSTPATNDDEEVSEDETIEVLGVTPAPFARTAPRARHPTPIDVDEESKASSTSHLTTSTHLTTQLPVNSLPKDPPATVSLDTSRASTLAGATAQRPIPSKAEIRVRRAQGQARCRVFPWKRHAEEERRCTEAFERRYQAWRNGNASRGTRSAQSQEPLPPRRSHSRFT